MQFATNPASAFLSVALGGIFAALGGLIATQINDRLERARLSRSAALLFGEILAAAGTLIRLAETKAASASFRDPMVLHLIRAARRELNTYDRNRELLFNLRDPDLRARLHSFMVRLTIPLDSLIEEQSLPGEDAGLMDAQGTADMHQSNVAETYSFLFETKNIIPELLICLQLLAGADFKSYDRIGDDGLPSVTVAKAPSGK